MTSTRQTTQRIKIFEHLQNVKTHPTAEMVYKAIRKDLPAISLATVYRNLHLLADEGKILRLKIKNEYHFDGDICNHQHCVCRKCGKITDVFQKEISEYVLKKMKTKDFKPTCVNIIYSGYCKQEV